MHIRHGGSDKKIWYTVLFQKNWWKNGRPPQKPQRKFIFHVNVPAHAHQKLFLLRFFLKIDIYSIQYCV